MEPNTPASPEFIKAFSYFPGTILREVTAEGVADTIDDIIQIIIRELGVPTVRRFERALKDTWSHLANAKPSSATVPRPLPDVRGVPQPIPDNSCRYLFYGRSIPVNALTDLRDIERHLQQQSIVDDEGVPVSRPSGSSVDEDEESQTCPTVSGTLKSGDTREG